MGKKYMTTKEAAERWGYAESTVCKWCRDGVISVELRPEKKSGRWQIPAEAKCPRPIKTKA